MKLIFDLFSYILNRLLDLFYFLFDWFLELSLPEKIIFLNAITAFFAVVMPSAKYFIFDNWNTANNPLNVYLIGIAFYMFVTIFFKGYWVVISRVGLNLYFIAWLLYYQFVNPFVKCEHQIVMGYYLNYVATSIYVILSIISFFRSNE